MKSRILGAVLLVGCGLGVLLGGAGAKPVAPDPGGGGGGGVAECMQDCFDQWMENKASCEKAAFICDFRIPFVGCVSSHYDLGELFQCRAEACSLYSACIEECKPQG